MPVTSINQANTVPVAAGTPGSSAVGDSASAGTATTMSRSDHVHGREAFATTPSTQAIGDAAAAGTATTVTRGDHKHAMPSFGTPVTADGQTTSLSAGSLTTIARADHVHTLSNVAVLIGSSTLGTASTSVTFSSISSSYKHLMLLIAAKLTNTGGAVDTVDLRLNGDTGSNYIDAYTATTTASLVFAGYLNTASNFLDVNATSQIFISPCASGAYHHVYGMSTYNGLTSAYSNGYVFIGYQAWKSTNALTSIQVLNRGGLSFKANSSFTLYGLP